MGNVLKMQKQQQIQALTALGWSNRAISTEIGVDRETVAKYRQKIQNQPKVPTDSEISDTQNPPEVPADPDGQNPPEMPTGQLPKLPPTNSAQLRPFVDEIRKKYLQRLTAQRIYQDLVEEHEYKGSYDSVKRYVHKLRKRHRRYRERLPHLPGREAQVDFGKSTCLVNVNGVISECGFSK